MVSQSVQSSGGPNLIKMTKMSPEIEENMEGEVYSVAKHTLPISSEFLRECYFAFKAWNAQQAGAAAVLVADNIDEPLLTMDFPEMRTGMTPLLIARLDHQDAIARLNLLKLIKAKFCNP
ncbi:hypothetical protein OIU77_025038 [Salix suchowensis]|uniref:PA domain-containing protein n=1 Tax=Salix suchowensis TaxID=1278906 RepID=A0ABQ9BYW3_9ROSI|nr:hypothetical protein OIU77_025038 [Salix suchowensis]